MSQKTKPESFLFIRRRLALLPSEKLENRNCIKISRRQGADHRLQDG